MYRPSHAASSSSSSSYASSAPNLRPPSALNTNDCLMASNAASLAGTGMLSGTECPAPGAGPSPRLGGTHSSSLSVASSWCAMVRHRHGEVSSASKAQQAKQPLSAERKGQLQTEPCLEKMVRNSWVVKGLFPPSRCCCVAYRPRLL